MNISEQQEIISANNITITENLEAIYNAGKAAGISWLWDGLQRIGKRTGYSSSWFQNMDNKYFYPKHIIKLVGSNNSIFSNFGRDEETGKIQAPIDFVERFNECESGLDTSGCTSFRYMFNYASTNHLPVIDCTSADMSLSPFVGMLQSLSTSSGASLVTIDKIILSNEGAYLNGMFDYNSTTKNVIFEGLIIKDVTVKSSPFTADTAKSMISCLKNYSGTDEELKYTVSFNSGIWTRLNASGLPPSENSWEEYVHSLGYNVSTTE